MSIALGVTESDELRSVWLRELSFGPQFERNLQSVQDAILMLAHSHHIRLPAQPCGVVAVTNSVGSRLPMHDERAPSSHKTVSTRIVSDRSCQGILPYGSVVRTGTPTSG